MYSTPWQGRHRQDAAQSCILQHGLLASWPLDPEVENSAWKRAGLWSSRLAPGGLCSKDAQNSSAGWEPSVRTHASVGDSSPANHSTLSPDSVFYGYIPVRHQDICQELDLVLNGGIFKTTNPIETPCFCWHEATFKQLILPAWKQKKKRQECL